MVTIKNKYIRFIATCVLFISLTVVLDRFSGRVLRYFYFRTEYGTIYHLRYSLDSTKADIIILGSSRAHGHYVPRIIEDSLSLTCFNTGQDGNYLLNNYAVFKSLIERYTPEIVLMDISLGELYIGSGGYDELSYLLPYYRNKPEIRDVLLLKGKFEKLKLTSELYPFNSSLLAVAEGNIRTENFNDLKGYRPLYGMLVDTCLKYSRDEEPGFDTNKIKALDVIASECKLLGIKLVFIQSPRYAIVSQEIGVSAINELAAKHNAEFWNYVNDTMFLKPEYFRDGAHLNDHGARKFTEIISHRLME